MSDNNSCQASYHLKQLSSIICETNKDIDLLRTDIKVRDNKCKQLEDKYNQLLNDYQSLDQKYRQLLNKYENIDQINVEVQTDFHYQHNCLNLLSNQTFNSIYNESDILCNESFNDLTPKTTSVGSITDSIQEIPESVCGSDPEDNDFDDNHCLTVNENQTNDSLTNSHQNNNCNDIEVKAEPHSSYLNRHVKTEDLSDDNVEQLRVESHSSGIQSYKSANSEHFVIKPKIKSKSNKNHLKLVVKTLGPSIRNKNERKKLNGYSCKECIEYFKGRNYSEEERERRQNACSRHRAEHSPPKTPQHFWETHFPSTPECIQRGTMLIDKSEDINVTQRKPRKQRRIRLESN